MNDLPAQVHDTRIRVIDLGRMAYVQALALQRRLQREVMESRQAEDAPSRAVGHLLLLEHDPPVITLTQRRETRGHLVASSAQLRAAGIELAETDRGGDITYHGPGQLVVYPILDLAALNLRLGSYMRWLEQIIIDQLATLDIAADRDPAAPGVWVRPNSIARDSNPANGGAAQHQPPAKICAMGVRISRWVSMHGLALNVTTNLEHFDLIVPCGLAGRGVTSLQRELASRCPTMTEVKRRITEGFQTAIERRLRT